MDKAAMLARQKELLDAAEAEKRDLTEEGQREFDSLTEQIRKAAEQEEPTGQERSGGESQPEGDGGEAGRAAAEAEQKRALAIMDLCAGTKLNARALIAEGKSVNQVRVMVNEAMISEHPPIPQGQGVIVDAADRFRAAAVDSALMRAGMHLDKPADGARELMGMSLRDIAIRCLAADGMGSVNELLSTDSRTLFEAAMSTYRPGRNIRAFMQPTGQFPVFLDTSIEKALVDWYQHPDYQFEKIVTVGTLPDFKPHDDNYMSGPVGDFEELPEGGTMKEDTFEYIQLGQRKLKSYAKRFSLSYQAFVNDDIGMIVEMPVKFARAWRRTLNNMIFSLLIDNAVTGDGAKFFSAPHKNLLSQGTTVTADAIASMRMALRNQTDDNGQPIVITPKQILVPTGLDREIYTLFMSPVIETATNTQAANPMYGNMPEVIEDETLNLLAKQAGMETVPWFMIGDGGNAPGIELDYLNGTSQLQKRMGRPMDQLGFVWNFWCFAGVTVRDYRRYVCNPGVEIKAPIPVVE